MAIQALYPSRRQSRWTNPLFLRQRLRVARRAAMVAAIFVFAAYGIGHLERAQPQLIPAQQSNNVTSDAAFRIFDLHAKPAPVRVVPLSFNPQDAAKSAS
jgi:hypothetical protein